MPTLHDLRTAHTLHLEAVIAFLIAQSECYHRFGSGAQRCLHDDDRRQMATLAQAVGWELIGVYLTLVSVRKLQRWYRTLVMGAVSPTKSPGRPRTDPVIEAQVVRLAQPGATMPGAASVLPGSWLSWACRSVHRRCGRSCGAEACHRHRNVVRHVRDRRLC